MSQPLWLSHSTYRIYNSHRFAVQNEKFVPVTENATWKVYGIKSSGLFKNSGILLKTSFSIGSSGSAI